MVRRATNSKLIDKCAALWTARNYHIYKLMLDPIYAEFTRKEDRIYISRITLNIAMVKSFKYHVLGNNTKEEVLVKLKGVKPSFNPHKPLKG